MRNIADKTFFDDALLEFGDHVTVYTRDKVDLNEYGEVISTYKKYTIWGSLQPESNSRAEVDKGSHIEQLYNFYCDSVYRIYIDDIILTESGEWLQVYEYTPWDLYGVREVKCKSVNLTETRDLKEFKKYLDTIDINLEGTEESVNTNKNDFPTPEQLFNINQDHSQYALKSQLLDKQDLLSSEQLNTINLDHNNYVTNSQLELKLKELEDKLTHMYVGIYTEYQRSFTTTHYNIQSLENKITELENKLKLLTNSNVEEEEEEPVSESESLRETEEEESE